MAGGVAVRSRFELDVDDCRERVGRGRLVGVKSMLLIDSETIDSYEVIDALARLVFGGISDSSAVFPSASFSSSSSGGNSTCSLLSVLATVFPLALDSFSKTSSNAVSNLPLV